MPIIDAQAVSYQYEHSDTVAVDNVDLSIQSGEFVAVLGHNGSGKSTFAKLINALMLPKAGTLWVDGISTKDVEQLFTIRKTAGMVFQNPDNQIIATIVEEDVAFGPENLGLAREKIIERVNFAIERVGMTAFKQRPPHMLSGGQKQRISIAGVLAMKPKCIVFDEPTAMLDPAGRQEVIDTILSLHQEGITVVLITHFMNEALLADRVVLMDHGKIVKADIPDKIFKDVDGMQQLSLDVPYAVKIADGLRKRGIALNEEILTREQLVKALCQYNSNR